MFEALIRVSGIECVHDVFLVLLVVCVVLIIIAPFTCLLCNTSCNFPNRCRLSKTSQMRFGEVRSFIFSNTISKWQKLGLNQQPPDSIDRAISAGFLYLHILIAMLWAGPASMAMSVCMACCPWLPTVNCTFPRPFCVPNSSAC